MIRSIVAASRYLVLAAVLGVMFLGFVVAWDGTRDLLGIGVAIALVIAALTYFLSTVKGGKADKATPYGKDPTAGGRGGG